MPDASASSPSYPIISFRGVPIRAERPKGFIQTGTDKAGKAWARVYGYDRRTGEALPGFITYGDIEGTSSSDGERLDAYLGDNLDADTVYVIEQGEPDPELKLVFGVPDIAMAERFFSAHVPEEMLASIRAVPLELVQALLGVTEGDVVEKAAAMPEAAAIRSAIVRAHREAAICKAAELVIDASTFRRDRSLDGHPCVSQPLSGVYPSAVLGGDPWLGWIEPQPRPAWNPRSPSFAADIGAANVNSSGDWIAFVDASGMGLLWEQREGGSGRVLGAPIPFARSATAREQDQSAAVAEATRERLTDTTSAHVRAIRSVIASLLVAANEPPALPPIEPQPPQAHFIAKTADAALRYILAIVLEPLDHTQGEADTQGHFYTVETIRKAQWYWTKSFRNVLLLHSRQGGVPINDKVLVADNYTAAVDQVIAGSNIKRGTWLVGMHFYDDELWGMVERGELQSVSIEGLGELTPIDEIATGA